MNYISKLEKIPPRYFAAAFGLIHLIVDACTVMVIFSTRYIHGLHPYAAFYIVIGYDILAFAGQTPLGYLLDRFKIPKLTAVVGLFITGVSLGFLFIHPIAAMILAGVGNAMFHVGAGALVLFVNPGRAAAPGVFVGPGALGLAIGTIVGKGGYLVIWPFALAIAIAFVASFFFKAPDVTWYREKPPKIKVDYKWLIVFLLLFSIFVRSLVGKAGISFAPKITMVLVGLAFAAFAGKSVGGILADRFGWITMSVGALVVSAPLLAFLGDNPIGVILGLFIFQTTMPVTLVATHMMMPRWPGVAFGLNCLAYILGFLATIPKFLKAYYGQLPIFITILLSAAAVFIALRMLKGRLQMRFD